VYVVSHQRDPVTITAVAVFARDAATGSLTQLPGTQGCISEHLGPDVCTPAVGLLSARSVAVSRDGKHVYVAAEADSVAVFARDAATGALTQLAEPHGCVSQSGSGGRCTQGKALDGAYAVVVSKDGRFVYVASQLSRAVAVFRRHRKTGVLTQLADEAGCIAEDGSVEQCTDGTGLRGPTSLALSPNGKSVYVASDGGSELAVLARSRRTGKLRAVQCFDDDGSAACERAVGMRQPHSVTVSPDGERVYVAARDDDAVAVFARDAATGALLQPDGRAACVSDDGSEGLCTDGRALDHPRSVTVSADGRHVYVAAQGSGVAVLQPKR
jgi:DNA-binding beta-propeller fold protein YncE